MKLKSFTSVLLAVCLFVACNKDEEIQIEGPSGPINISGLPSNDTLRNEVTAELKWESNGKLAKIEVFANDSLIATGTASPLTLTWNTLKTRDGDYTIKAVATENSGQKKEVTRKAVVNNALVTIEQGALINSFAIVDYIITDDEGNVLTTARFERPDFRTVSLYPKEAFSGKQINVIRVNQSSYKTIDAFVGINRGARLKNKHVQGTPNLFKTGPMDPIEVKINKAPAYDNLTVSGDRSGFSLPINNYQTVLYSSESKLFLQLEKDGSAVNHFYDLPQLSRSMEIDASLCMTPSNKKTVMFPTGVKEGYVYAQIKPYKGFGNNYQVANKTFTGAQVHVFYPYKEFFGFSSTITFNTNNVDYLHYYFDKIPEKVELINAAFDVRKTSVLDFEADISGETPYYALHYQNDASYPYGDPRHAYLTIYLKSSQEKFQFPGISRHIDIPSFNLADFKLWVLKFYKFDKPSTLEDMFGSEHYVSDAFGSEAFIGHIRF